MSDVSSRSELSRRNLLRLSLAGSASLLVTPLSSGLGAAAESQDTPANIPYAPVKLDEKVTNLLAKIPHSVLLYDLGEVENCYRNFLQADPDAEVHYAVKCAPNPRVMSRLVRAGSGFDVASRAEVDLALDAGADPAKCIYSNTCKFPEDVRYAHSKGIQAFLADSEYEVRLQAENAPGSKLYVRLLVDNKDAAHPLGEKFGTTPEKAKELLRLGKKLGLVPYGTHFHVGTQCYSAKAWETPSRQAASIFRDLKKEGITLELFDIGGGFPVQYLGRKVPTNAEILQLVRNVLREELGEFPLTLAIEPGRGLVGSAALMSSRVMLRAARPDAEWLHLDVGVYHGLSDAPDGIRYAINAINRNGPPAPFTLCGPTCDSADTISTRQELPSDVATGDLLILNDTGAYAECLFSHFNGIQPPEVKYLDDII
jgi:ornithine decarboxylase